VSLLLEALKKAEAAKRRDEEPAVDSPPPPAAPMPTPAPVRITPAHELELIDDEIAQAARFAGLDVPEPRSTPSVAPPPGAEAARVLFDVKRPQDRRRSPLSWLLGGAALLLLGIGAWVAWQIGLLESGQRIQPAPALARADGPRVPMQPNSLPVQPAPTNSEALAPAITAAEPTAAEPRPVSPVAAMNPAPALAAAEPSRYLSGQAAPAPAAPAAQAPPSLPPASPIRVTRNAPSVPQDVSDGFAAFNAGEFDRARIAYERALRADPRNPDALHGLMALAQQRGDDTQARQLMRRIADIDPADTSIQVAMNDHVDPAQREARLLNIAAAQPQSAAVALALGNLYASQARWREAQQAYFNAWTLSPDQPDHAYNLAVSLDQLRQSRLALQYYREALALRGQRAAAFDAQRVEMRIETLQAQVQNPPPDAR
jgi:tetratricopeptide (TPR) repeat protein